MNLERLFHPSSVAVIGASRDEDKIGYQAMVNAVEFDGPVYPVNPSSEGTFLGERFVDSVGEVDGRVDLALLCVPASVVPEVIEECGEADVGGAVVYAGGFAEAGGEGERLQEHLVDVADEYDLPVLGPNTSGFVVPADDLFVSFASGVERFSPGHVAVLAQSGGVAHVLGFQALADGRGVSAMVGLGNRANVDFPEAVSYFDGDDRTGAIVLHVEGTGRGRATLEACRGADTPVVAYKVGESDVGEFAASHTGALTGDHELYTAGFAQYGVPTVDSTTELGDAGVALARSPRPSGRNVGVVTAQAGPGIIVADRIQRGGGRLPELSPSTRERVDELLPGITYTGNPIDTGRPSPAFGDLVGAVAGDERVDIVVVYELFEAAIGYPVEALAGLAERVDKPVLFATGGPESDIADGVAALREAGVPVFDSPERVGEAAAALARYAVLEGGAGDPEEVRAGD